MADQGATEADAARVWFRLLRLQTRMNVALADRLKSIGLSIPQCDVLTTLTEREGISQQDLAARLYVTKGNISGLVDRLEAAGFVERRSLAGDRRSHAIYLTEAGRQVALEGIALQRDFVGRTIGRLPADDLVSLEGLIVRVRDMVRETTEAEKVAE